MTITTVRLMRGAGIVQRLVAALRWVFSIRLLAAVAGYPVVVLAGRARMVMPQPLGVQRKLVPALVRCSKKFEAVELDDDLFADLVLVLSLGLGLSVRTVERLPIELTELQPVIVQIAHVNGLLREAGRATAGEPMLIRWILTGMGCTPGSSMPLGGHGTTSTPTYH